MRFDTPGRTPTGRRDRGSRRGFRPTVAALETRALLSLTVQFDYTYDADGFFNTQSRRDLLQAAANADIAQLTDTLTAITPSGGNTWSATFPNPATGAIQSVANLNVPANTIIIYVGGGTLSGASEAGLGSTGGYTANSSTGDQSWLNTVAARGQVGALATPATDYGPWGGSIAFDDSGSTNWYFNQSLSGIGATQTDFLSVAEHEICHVLGIGTTPAWNNLVSGGYFHGAAAEAVYGGPVPVNPAGDHWAQGVMSGGTDALMDPTLYTGTRVTITPLDLAGLADIGWQVQPAAPPTVQFATNAYAGTNGGPAVTVTVTRTGGTGAFTVHYATADGTDKAGVDYTAAAGTLSFAAGATSETFTITLLNDPTGIPAGTINLALTAPTGGAALGTTATAVVTVAGTKGHATADFDGDGKTDLAIFRPGTTRFLIDQSTSGGLTPIPVFGAPNYGDIPVIGDFDGVGHPEVAVYRPSTSQWFVLGPTGGHLLGTFGGPGDVPVPGDYDGTGKTELAVYRPSTSQWFVLGPTGGRLLGTFGGPNDLPVPGDYDGTGKTEMAVFRPSTAQWFVLGPNGGRLLGTFGAPNLFDVPVPGDYDGIGHTEMAVYRPTTGQWFVMGLTGGRLLNTFGDPTYADIPAEAPVDSLVLLGVAKPASRSVVTKSASAALIVAAPMPAPRSNVAQGEDLWLAALEQLDGGLTASS